APAHRRGAGCGEARGGAGPAGTRALGGWPRHRRPPVRAGKGQPADPRGLCGAPCPRRDRARRAGAKPALHRLGIATARLPAALQPLRPGDDLRRACRQRHTPGHRHGGAHPHRRLLHALPQRPGQLRGGRADRRGHLWREAGEAARRRCRHLPGDQPAPRGARDQRLPPRELLLGAEHGAGRRPAQPALRSRHGSQPRPRRPAAGPRRADRAHRRVPQPAAPLGRRM
ncbi:MAG: PKHD-type hydroxylase YbiX, partial [uncultured Craurococcus sp.]